MADSLKNLGKKIGLRISAHKTKIQKTQNLENYADIFLERAPQKIVENNLLRKHSIKCCWY